MGVKESGKVYPRASHPIVRTHPVTKRKALYVNGDFTTHIDGLPLEEVLRHPEILVRVRQRGEEFQVRFGWKPHSVCVSGTTAASSISPSGTITPQTRLPAAAVDHQRATGRSLISRCLR